MAASSAESSTLSNMSIQSAYRTTCDNCMRSKVRCSKDHPSCHRCLGHGVTCVYSPSRRLKKMIEYRDTTQQANPNANVVSEFFQNVPSRNERERSEATPMQDDRISTPDIFSSTKDRSYPSPWSFFGNDSEVQESVIGMEGITQPAAAFTTLHERSHKKGLNSPTHQWSCSMDVSTGDALVPISPDANHDFISSLFSSSQDHFSSSALDTHHRSGSTSGTDLIEEGSSKPGCAGIAAFVLQSLESPGAPLQHDTQPSTTSQGRLRRNLDTVISTNKAVMEIMHRISNCTCSVPGNHLVIISAVLFMVLAWYEACLGACDRACEESAIRVGPGDASMSEARQSEARRCEADSLEVETETGKTKDSDHAELVWIPPIQVGSLQLGADSKRQVVAQIVLTELAKVTRVIETLTERSSSSSMSPALAGVSGNQELEAQLQFSLRATLQTRIEKISQAAERASK